MLGAGGASLCGRGGRVLYVVPGRGRRRLRLRHDLWADTARADTARADNARADTMGGAR